MKNNEHQEKNRRDLTIGYVATGTCYLIIGALGYFGFRGNGFPQGIITQNALDMFANDNPFAFIIRFMLFL
jgi:F0F1-type ATP synthase membrane subunit c/vacuolar-type H+-ATPase subunit K